MKRLSRHVGEFTIRLNEGNVRIDTIDRLSSLGRRVRGKAGDLQAPDGEPR